MSVRSCASHRDRQVEMGEREGDGRMEGEKERETGRAVKGGRERGEGERE